MRAERSAFVQMEMNNSEQSRLKDKKTHHTNDEMREMGMGMGEKGSK